VLLLFLGSWFGKVRLYFVGDAGLKDLVDAISTGCGIGSAFVSGLERLVQREEVFIEGWG